MGDPDLKGDLRHERGFIYDMCVRERESRGQDGRVDGVLYMGWDDRREVCI